MEKNEGSEFIKFSSKIDKQLAKTKEVQAKKKSNMGNKENPKDYLEDYSSAATPSGASPPASPAWAPTSSTTSLMEPQK